VVQQILDRVAGTRWPIEHSAYHNRVVCCIVMSERALGVILAPRKVRATEHATEEARVKRIENFVKIVITSFWPEEALAPARVANDLRLPRYSRARCKPLVAHVLRCINWLLVQLCQQDMRN